MRIRNIHERSFSQSRERVAELLDGLASANDPFWPGDRWPPLRLDASLGVGAAGGHGPVRYRVSEYDPGRKVVFRFDNTGLAAGLDGYHFFEIVPQGEKVVLRHIIDAECGFAKWLEWMALIRPLHDALLEDALDRAERSLDPTSAGSTRWSLWVRVLRFVLARADTRP